MPSSLPSTTTSASALLLPHQLKWNAKVDTSPDFPERISPLFFSSTEQEPCLNPPLLEWAQYECTNTPNDIIINITFDTHPTSSLFRPYIYIHLFCAAVSYLWITGDQGEILTQEPKSRAFLAAINDRFPLYKINKKKKSDSQNRTRRVLELSMCHVLVMRRRIAQVRDVLRAIPLAPVHPRSTVEPPVTARRELRCQMKRTTPFCSLLCVCLFVCVFISPFPLGPVPRCQ